MSNAKLDARGLPMDYPFKPAYERTPREVAATLRDNPHRVKLLDVRTQEEWDLVHVPGSIHIPLSELEKRADEIELEDGQELAVICHHGVRSLKGALALRALGFPNAKSVAGGIDLWSMAAEQSPGDAPVPRYAREGGRCWLI